MAEDFAFQYTCCRAGERASPCPTESTSRKKQPVYTTLAEQPSIITGTTSTASDSGLKSARKATPLHARPAPTKKLRLIFSDTRAATFDTKMYAIAAIIKSPPRAEAVVANATFRCSGRITSLKATVDDTSKSEARERVVCVSLICGVRGSIFVNSASFSRKKSMTKPKSTPRTSAPSKQGMNAPSELSYPPISGPIVSPKPPQK